jgi:hypothetical protein
MSDHELRKQRIDQWDVFTALGPGWGMPIGSSETTTHSSLLASVDRTIDGYRGPRKGAGPSHPCVQNEYRTSPVSYEAHVINNTYQYGLSESGLYPVGVEILGGVGCAAKITGTAAPDPDSTQRLVDGLMGEIPSTVSLPNLILELPQSLNLWNDLAAPVRSMMSHRSGTTRQRIRRMAKDGANASLAESFGLIPLVQDIKALWNLSNTVQTRRDKFLSIPTSWTKFRKQVSAEASYYVRADGSSPSWHYSAGSCAASCQMWITGKMQRTRQEDATLTRDLAMDTVNITRPLDVLWEATPFSFVVDWFLPVGRYLHTLNRGKMFGSLAVENVCTHKRVNATGLLYCDIAPHTALPLSGGPIAFMSHKGYIRDLGFPGIDVQVSMPGIRQSILGASLILQRTA